MKMKKYCNVVLVLILIFIMILTTAGCGGGNSGRGIPWTKQLGSSGYDNAYGVAVDGRGNVYITGETYGDFDGNTSAGNRDIFLMKYDSSGTKQWTKQLGTSAVDDAYGVAVDGSDNVYITGSTNGGLDGNTNAGSYDMILVKYDSLGAKQWTWQFGSSSTDDGRGVAVDGSGNIYITGSTAGGLDGNTNAGSYDMFLVKHDSSGWTKQLGALSADHSNGVAVDGIGNIYITGIISGCIVGKTTTAGGYDILLVKYDSLGDEQWTRQLGSSGEDTPHGVAVDGYGNVYITGSTNGGLDGNNAGDYDIFLVKYDSAGTKQWTKQLGTSAVDNAYGVAVDGSGNVYITGKTYGGLDGNTNAGSYDMFLVKYDSSGDKQWTRQFGSSSSDIGNGVAVDGISGNIYITGSTAGGLDGNTNAGNCDIFLVKYDPAGMKQ